MDLKEYLEFFSNPNPHNQDPDHHQLIRDIRLKPEIIELPHRVETFREVELEEGHLTDLAALADDGRLYIVEGKIVRPKHLAISHIILKGSKTRQLINAQLRRAYDYFKDRFEVEATLVGAYITPFSRKINYYRLLV